MLQVSVSHFSSAVRAAAAGHPLVSTLNLHILATDPEGEVREAALLQLLTRGVDEYESVLAALAHDL
ncbi:hypothetical protein [Naasia sp. SYSU D00057]|uniref:hypothetical protein n=1 Tax=Naasia sp. SYSU D00057 TaxID=2817380 RepID=UPI001B306424|nr:hypothetical protein [Naasia sp. SYSU D00057]